MLGKVKEKVTVHYPEHKGAYGVKPAHTETYEVKLDEVNMPKDIINVETLSSNLDLWTSRGYQIDY